MHSKPELINALNTQKLEFQNFLSSIPSERFFERSSENWSIAHHLKHITSVINRIATGLLNPGVLPKREPATPSRDFATMHQTYLNTLQNTPSETLRQFGNRVTLEEHTDLDAYKNQMIASFTDAITNFNTALEAFNEEHLEALGMPHPLLGLISSREMVFFTVFHNAHHRKGIHKLLEKT